MKNMTRKWGFIKQKYDSHDISFDKLTRLKNIQTIALPLMVNNRYWCSAVDDQGELGSCTSEAWSGLLEYNQCANGLGGKFFKNLSRLFIYYNERVIENTVNEDSGAELRDGAKALATYGVCPEVEWPYITSRFTIKPTPQCYTDGVTNEIVDYYALTTLNDMKSCLADGRCFVFGFNVYSDFQSQRMAGTGILNVPLASESLLGGHAVMAVGYDDKQSRFLIKNSWGKQWGLVDANNAGNFKLKGSNLGGYFTMPYDYITNPDLASDFWTVGNQKVTVKV
jgi:C1A family cysteine protease